MRKSVGGCACAHGQVSKQAHRAETGRAVEGGVGQVTMVGVPDRWLTMKYTVLRQTPRFPEGFQGWETGCASAKSNSTTVGGEGGSAIFQC